MKGFVSVSTGFQDVLSQSGNGRHTKKEVLKVGSL